MGILLRNKNINKAKVCSGVCNKIKIIHFIKMERKKLRCQQNMGKTRFN